MGPHRKYFGPVRTGPRGIRSSRFIYRKGWLAKSIQILVKFEIDPNGILNVGAED